MRSLCLLSIVFLGLAGFAENKTLVLWSGGVSRMERAAAPSEGAKLVFFVTNGSYLTGVDVSVKTKSGQELVDVSDTGPWLILDLADGDYTVVATRDNGDVQSAVISVDRNAKQEFGFMFPGD